MRSGTIYIEPDVLWMLRATVKALNLAQASEAHTVDGLATNALRDWLQTNYPEIVEISERWNELTRQREALSEQAVAAATKAKE